MKNNEKNHLDIVDQENISNKFLQLASVLPTFSPPATAAAAMTCPIADFTTTIDEYRYQIYHYAISEQIKYAQCQDNVDHHRQLDMSQQRFSVPNNLYPQETERGHSIPLSFTLLQPYHHYLSQDEPKPQHSYIGLIAMAILSSPDKKLVLSDIYQHILKHYPYFRRRGPGWRNSIRHNLSLNDCFVKSGRSANGKGHYWAIHPANIDDFRRGDFRRRKAQRKVRRHMGLSIDEESDTPSPPLFPINAPAKDEFFYPMVQNSWVSKYVNHGSPSQPLKIRHNDVQFDRNSTLDVKERENNLFKITKKRQFDVASLLKPDEATSVYASNRAADKKNNVKIK